MSKISCGGWYIDDDTLEFEPKTRTLRVKENPGIGPMGSNLDMAGKNIINATSISGLPETHQVTIEDELNMNNHRITGVSKPQAPQDVVTMEYLGEVMKAAKAVDNVTGDTAQDVKATLNALLEALREVGLLAQG